jgi:hypothetical protein
MQAHRAHADGGHPRGALLPGAPRPPVCTRCRWRGLPRHRGRARLSTGHHPGAALRDRGHSRRQPLCAWPGTAGRRWTRSRRAGAGPEAGPARGACLGRPTAARGCGLRGCGHCARPGPGNGASTSSLLPLSACSGAGVGSGRTPGPSSACEGRGRANKKVSCTCRHRRERRGRAEAKLGGAGQKQGPLGG